MVHVEYQCIFFSIFCKLNLSLMDVPSQHILDMLGSSDKCTHASITFEYIWLRSADKMRIIKIQLTNCLLIILGVIKS